MIYLRLPFADQTPAHSTRADRPLPRRLRCERDVLGLLPAKVGGDVTAHTERGDSLAVVQQRAARVPLRRDARGERENNASRLE